jgi:ribose transport system substrate-binding protein
MNRFLVTGLAAALAVAGVSAEGQEKKQMAFVVNGASDFWKLAEAGVNKAQAELPDYELQFRYPSQATAALQNALMDDLVAAGTDAIMISSVDPKTSIDAFNRVAAQVPLFTTDSDAADSDRVAYVGSSNTDAGVQAGEIAKKALPDGGKCMGFVGLLGADNAVERIAGFRQAVEGTGIELVDVRGDDIDFARARSNVDDVLAANPEITCMVGFYSYNSPKIYEALQAAGKAWPDHRHRLRRGPDHARRRPGRLVRRHRGAAAVRVGLSGHAVDGEVPGGRPVGDPRGRADHHPDRDHRQVERRRVRG